MGLTVQSIRVAKPDPSGKRREIPDGADGLRLVIQPSGKKSWAVRYRNAEGVTRKFTLGPVLLERDVPLKGLPPIGTGHTLAEARKAAKAAMVLVLQGADPAGARQAIKSPADDGTLSAHAERFLKAKASKRTVAEMRRRLEKHVLPVLGARHVEAITKKDVVAVCDKLTDAENPVLANRTFGTMRTLFRWLVGRGVLNMSPCDGLTLPNPDSEIERSRVLTDAELARVWAATFDLGKPFGPVVRLLILTGQRRGEVSGLVEGEIDRVAACWILPPERAKNGREHIVPLAAAALAELLPPPKPDDADDAEDPAARLLFTTTGDSPLSGWTRMKRRLDRLSGVSGWVLHDLRRTAATNLQRLGFALDVTEAVLNHVGGSRGGIVSVYQTHDYADEKREALNALARFVVDVVAHDARRARWDAMRGEAGARDRAAFRSAIRADNDTWSAYIAALDAPEAPEAADDAEALEVAA